MLMTEIESTARKQIANYISGWKTDAYIPLVSEWSEENRVHRLY